MDYLKKFIWLRAVIVLFAVFILADYYINNDITRPCSLNGVTHDYVFYRVHFVALCLILIAIVKGAYKR